MAAQEVICTSNPTRDYKFSWAVENVSLTPNILQGHSFTPIPGVPVNLRLKLLFKRVSDASDYKSSRRHYATLEVILVDLNTKTSESSRLTFSGECSFVINGGCLRADSTDCTDFNGSFVLLNYTTQKFVHPVSKRFLTKYVLNVKEDKLIINGKLTFSGYNIATSVSSLTDKENCEACGQLSNDLKIMFENGSSSDIEFCVGEETLRAHKNILSCRSPVFAKMFSSDMVENKSNKVLIVDADSHVFKCFLVFLYTGIVEDKVWDTVLSLHSLAHKYEVKSLFAICSQILSSKLTVDYLCSVLVLSDLLGDEELKNAAKIFIRLHLVQIVGTTEWAEIINANQELVKDILA